MGFGSAKPPNVGKHKSKMTNRNVQHRAAKAHVKLQKGAVKALAPVGRDKKKTQIVARRAAHHKRSLIEKAAGGKSGSSGGKSKVTKGDLAAMVLDEESSK